MLFFSLFLFQAITKLAASICAEASNMQDGEMHLHGKPSQIDRRCPAAQNLGKDIQGGKIFHRKRQLFPKPRACIKTDGNSLMLALVEGRWTP